MNWLFPIIAVAIVITLKLLYPRIVGMFGENIVSKRLKNLGSDYVVLNNLLLPSTGNTKNTQIDHVIVSNYGIFCIETKNYEGWIFGNARQEQWTKVMYKKKYRFYNPLRQNYAHCKAIEALIEESYPGIKPKGFVAFPSADKLKISGTDAVGPSREIIQKIKTFSMQELTTEQRNDIVQILTNASVKDKGATKQHIKDVKAIQNRF